MPKAQKSRRWTIDEKARNIHVIRIALKSVGDTQRVLLQSDVHWDNPHCDREMFTRHLDEAREDDAPIIDNGDFFCAMQGKWDKRANKNDLRPEHRLKRGTAAWHREICYPWRMITRRSWLARVAALIAGSAVVRLPSGAAVGDPNRTLPGGTLFSMQINGKDATLQHSDDGANWQSIGTYEEATGRADLILKRYIRAVG